MAFLDHPPTYSIVVEKDSPAQFLAVAPAELLGWLTLTHSVHWQAHYYNTGSGHVYQNRFKAFPVETDDHLYSELRYVERNPQRAGLVQRAEQWAWSSV